MAKHFPSENLTVIDDLDSPRVFAGVECRGDGGPRDSAGWSPLTIRAKGRVLAQPAFKESGARRLFLVDRTNREEALGSAANTEVVQ